MRAWAFVLVGFFGCAHRPEPWAERAATYLDGRAKDWMEHTPKIGNNFACAVNCHTTQALVLARPALGLGRKDPMIAAIRARIEERVTGVDDWSKAVPFYSKSEKPIGKQSLATEAVVNAATLVIDDQGELTPVSRRALGWMWQMQREDGGWDWLKVELEPWESRDDWGAALAALAVARTPATYRQEVATPVERLKSYLRSRSADGAHPLALHDQLMLLIASASWPGLVDAGTRVRIVAATRSAQRPDGGWSLATWGRGKRTDSAGESDGYATGFALVALCGAGERGDAIDAGVRWLRAHQAADGSWPGRSVNTADEINQRFMTDAATAYASLALARCRSN